jgi:PKHD-type hydroxylase
MRQQFHIWQSALSKEQIIEILNLVDNNSLLNAPVFSSSKSIQKKRSSKIYWINESWVQKLLWEYILEANKKTFHVDVINKSEIQFTEYRSHEGGKYDWHHDVNWNAQEGLDRKLSISIQLSDKTDYLGGDFEFEEINSSMDFKGIGTIIIFPSYLRHRVTKVTSGTRRSLVAWFYGPNWK